MNLKYVNMILLFSLFSCNNEEVNVDDKTLKIKVNVNEEIHSRAAISSSYFDENTNIGLWFLSESGGTYLGKSYNNIRFTSSGSGSSQKWNGASTIYKAGTNGMVLASYPYSTSNTDYKSVAMDMATQNDYMYATPIKGVNSNTSGVNIKMNHATSLIKVLVKKGTYPFTGVVKDIKITASNLGINGTLNLNGGAVTASTLASSFAMTGGTQTIDATGKSWESMFIPISKSAAVTISLNIDGTTYTVTSGALTPVAGQIQTIILTANGNDVQYSGATITNWTKDSTVGRNLIKNSETLFCNGTDYPNNVTISTEVIDGKKNGKITRKVAGTGSCYGYIFYSGNMTENLNLGQYVWSIDVKSNCNGFAYFDLRPNNKGWFRTDFNSTGDKWVRISGVMNCTSLSNNNNFSLFLVSVTGSNIGDYVYYKNPKIEKGSTATAWSPAPEDNGTSGNTTIIPFQ